MAPSKLYMVNVSPNARAVLLTAKAIGVTLKCNEIVYNRRGDLLDAILQNYSKHPLPVLADHGYVIWNSQAIIAFLIGKYAKEDDLYPRDHTQRALIHQLLDFSDVIFANFSCALRWVINNDNEDMPADICSTVEDAYGFLEELLKNKEWVVGDSLTIADLSLISNVTSVDTLIPVNSERYPNVCNWIRKCQELPYYNEANQVGLDHFKTLIKHLQV